MPTPVSYTHLGRIRHDPVFDTHRVIPVCDKRDIQALIRRGVVAILRDDPRLRHVRHEVRVIPHVIQDLLHRLRLSLIHI